MQTQAAEMTGSELRSRLASCIRPQSRKKAASARCTAFPPCRSASPPPWLWPWLRPACNGASSPPWLWLCVWLWLCTPALSAEASSAQPAPQQGAPAAGADEA